jgi:Predicted glycosyltransferases
MATFPAERLTDPAQFPVAIAAVTFRRPELLSLLLQSIVDMEPRPEHVIIVDNASGDNTGEVVEGFRETLGKNRFGEDRLIYSLQEENTGGAGGFSVGTKLAYDTGADWIWLMDDDVAVEPDALVKLYPWTKQFKVVQGRRYNFDGVPFYWQYHFNTRFGIPNPIAKENFGTAGYLPMNTMCFEGGMFHRSIPEQIGLPDPRFFIYWDDTVYGYLASKVTDCAVVDDFVMRRTRALKHLDMRIRRLNSTSDMVRFHIMRNRGYMARYFALHGDYNRFLFGVGTVLTLAKETIRIATVDKTWKSSMKALWRGVRAARKIYGDSSWEPMKPLKK